MMQRETEAQIAVAKYLDYRGLLYTASAAGMHTSAKQARIHKAMGVKKGFPDLLIFEPVMSDGCIGTAIEMKSEKGYARPEQKVWLEELASRGWKTAICKGSKSAIDLIEKLYGND